MSSMPAPITPYMPPQPTIVQCQACSALILVRLWKGGVFVELEPPISPVLGAVHTCRTSVPPPHDQGSAATTETSMLCAMGTASRLLSVQRDTTR